MVKNKVVLKKAGLDFWKEFEWNPLACAQNTLVKLGEEK